MKKIFLIIALLLVLAGCRPQPAVPAEEPGTNWRDIEIRDVATGEVFKISDFAGKPIVLESFAVWCPTCTQQQKQIKKMREQEKEDIIHVSLDTDPNEDRDIIQGHITRNGFDWLYVVSPVDLTRKLIDEFGVRIVDAPSAPVVIICKDQSARLLGRGVKSAATLLSEIEKGC